MRLKHACTLYFFQTPTVNRSTECSSVLFILSACDFIVAFMHESRCSVLNALRLPAWKSYLEHAHTFNYWKKTNDWVVFSSRCWPLWPPAPFFAPDRNVSSIWTTWASLNCSLCWVSWKESWRPETWSSRPWGWVRTGRHAPFVVCQKKKKNLWSQIKQYFRSWLCNGVEMRQDDRLQLGCRFESVSLGSMDYKCWWIKWLDGSDLFLFFLRNCSEHLWNCVPVHLSFFLSSFFSLFLYLVLCWSFPVFLCLSLSLSQLPDDKPTFNCLC